jgi:3'(2'), 5'-bisphosphate nucleotidase
MLNNIREIAVAAGREAMRFYKQPLPVDYKADDSPLTAADKAAHQLICARLRQLTPEIPVLSEESDPAEVAGRRSWQRFWLVDPLDGTKEFIKQTGEFTVNIALIVEGESRLGVVHAPAVGLTYLAEKPHGAFKQTNDQPPQPIQTRPSPLRNQEPSTTNQEPSTTNQEPGNRLTIVASRDHAGPMVKRLFESYPEAETKSMGSSLKFCLVAEGAADLYLRDAPTMEWDTAAAQCILEAAGGEVRDLDGARLTYNRENQKNPPIVALGDPSFPWLKPETSSP